MLTVSRYDGDYNNHSSVQCIDKYYYLLYYMYMKSFETDAEAKAYIRERVDVPVAESEIDLDDGLKLRTFPLAVGQGQFTNVYDLTYPARRHYSSIETHPSLTSVYDHVNSNPHIKVATGGGFFFLADQSKATPRQLSLNLALAESQMLSFPLADQEAVISEDNRLSTAHIRALGAVSLNGLELSWSGSLTSHDTDIKMYGSGNSIITHMQHDATGSIRVLDENSRFTPTMDEDDKVDIGLIRRDDGTFIGVTSSREGGLDIFSHDVVARMHEKHAHNRLPLMTVKTLGGRALDGSIQGAISVGPMLDEQDFTNHPINSDKSLGSKPPFLDIPLARTVLYSRDNEEIHICLFDGRPGSPVFPGITPQQAADFIKSEGEVAWGSFLDPGQTAKLSIRSAEGVASYGNTHYLKWPEQPGDKFVWVPQVGRPVASTIALQ